MKLNRKFASALLAGAMLAGVMAMPAMAENEGVSGVQNGATVLIEKVLNKDENAYAPTTTIGFTVAAATAESDEKDSNGNVVYSGVESAISTVGLASFAPGDSDIGADSVKANASFTIDPTKFSKPGVYKYTVTENDPTYPGISKDSSSKTLYVYVVNNTDGAYAIAATALVNADDSKSNSFTNTLTTNDLTVKKVISGTAADLNGQWEFTIKVDGEAGDQYKLVTADGTVNVLTSGVVQTLSLKNNQSFTVYGLSEEDTYTITEIKANTDGYKTSIDNTESENGIAIGSLDKSVTITYQNVKDYVTPTGLLMDIAPYVAMVVLAAAAAFVFLRRRSSNED